MFDDFLQGQSIHAHGKDWIIIRSLGNGNYMAIEGDPNHPGYVNLPAQMFVIAIPTNQE